MAEHDQMGLGQWADRTLGIEPEEEFPPVPPGVENITVDDLLANPDIPPEMREWLLMYKEQGEAFALANNPPGFVQDEGCWEKAKRAADHAESSDVYAFANWWYHEHC